MSNLVWPMLLAVGAGVAVVLQQVLNAGLKSELGSAGWTGFASYAIGTACMLAFAVALRDPLPSVAAMRSVPLWLWTGGLFGAVFIGLAILLVPKLGAAAFFALLVAGQMAASIALDHYGALGLEQRAIDPWRILGAGLLVAGVVLIRR